MPQLNPGPWFNLLLATWFVFWVIFLTKVKDFLYPNEPSYQKSHLHVSPWFWPWH